MNTLLNFLKKYKITICASIFFIAAAGCVKDEQPLDVVYHDRTSAQLYKMAEDSLTHKSYKNAIKYYQALDTLYPSSVYGERSHLHIIYAYYKDKDVASAEAAALRFIHLYPRSEYIDYVYYLKGLINFQPDRGLLTNFIPIDKSKRALGEAQRSYQDFAILVHRFPESPYTPDARQRMIYLRNLIAAHQYHIAKFYFDHQAYMAALNRGRIVMEAYSQSPAVIPTLGIMEQSYRKLHKEKQANQILELLSINYPNSVTYQILNKRQKREQA